MKDVLLHTYIPPMHSFSFSSFGVKLLGITLAYFAPIAPLVHAVMALWMIDWITGVWKSRIVKRRITSYRLRKTANKITGYMIALITAHILNQSLLNGQIHLPHIVAAYIGIIEFTSIMENLTEITGKNVLKEVAGKIWEILKDKTLK